MAMPVDLAVGIRHGDTCTCTPLDPITLTAQPVVVDRACPGQRELPRTGEIHGRLTITWPTPPAPFAPLPTWGVSLHDADTGEQILTCVRAVIGMGADSGWHEAAITADLTLLVDADGNPVGPTAVGQYREENGDLRTGVFRYLVAEMRIAHSEGEDNETDGTEEC